MPRTARTLLGEVIKQNPQEAQWYSTLAQVHSIEGDTEAALADCNRAVEVAPTHPGSFEGRAAIHILRGDLDKALADLTEAIRLAPFNTDYYLARGNVCQRIGKTEEAEADFARARGAGALTTGGPLDPNGWRARH